MSRSGTTTTGASLLGSLGGQGYAVIFAADGIYRLER